MSNEAKEGITIAELEGLAQAASDAVTDEMVGRLAATAGDAMDLIDRVNRSGLTNALPVIAEMVNNGDLARLAQLARVLGSAEDALTDEMVGRLTSAVGGGLELIDQVNRSGLDRAIPTLARMVQHGDLERIADLARVIGSAEDALTDEMVGRLAGTLGDALCMVDRVTRGSFAKLVDLADKLEAAGALDRLGDAVPRLVQHLDMVEQMLGCFETAAQETKAGPPAAGGVGGLWQLMREADNQETLRFVFALGRNLRRCSTKKA